MDGANAWQVFRDIRLPWLVPHIVLVAPSASRIRSRPWTSSTPRRAAVRSMPRGRCTSWYEEAYRWSNLGTAMAIVFVLWLICYLFSGVLLGIWQHQERTAHA